MADEVVKNVLRKWNMAHLIPIFEEQEIDEFSFRDLSNDSLKELIPKIGPRTKFMRHLELFRIDTNSETAGSGISVLEEKNLNCSETDNSQASTVTVDVDTIMSISNSGPSTSTRTSMFDSAEEDPSGSVNKLEAATAYKRATSDLKNFYGPREMKRSCRTAYHLNLTKFLKLTGAGKHILNNYELENRLTRKTRNLLVELIINAMLSEKEVLKDIDFEVIADKICNFFKGEVTNTYYIPRTSVSNKGANKKYINAKGKLVDKYRNLKHLFNSTKTSTKIATDDEKEVDIQDDIKVSAEWLQKWSHPEELVVENWIRSFPLRKNFKGTTVKQFLNEWPIIFKNNLTSKLIQLDFKQMFGTCNINIFDCFTKWQEFIDKLKCIKYGNATHICDNIELFQLLKNESIEEDSKNAIQFALLATLFPPKEIIRTNKKRYKPSIAECQESLIVFVEIPGDIENKIQSRKSRLQTFGLTDQPYLMVVGPSWINVTDFYAVIDENIVKCDTVLSAIDLLFKAFHVLNAQYPEESTHIWLLIQRWLYGVTTTTDKAIPYVSTLLQELSD